MTYILILANRRSVLGDAANGPRFRVLATVCVAIVGALSAVVSYDRGRVAVTAGGASWQRNRPAATIALRQTRDGACRPTGGAVIARSHPDPPGHGRVRDRSVSAWRVREVIRLAAISLFLSLALLPIVDALDRAKRVPRAVIILGIYLVLAGRP